MEDPEPFVLFHTFGESSVDLTVYFWVDTKVIHPLTAKSRGVQVIHDAFEEAGIEIPFPIRTVFLQKAEE